MYYSMEMEYPMDVVYQVANLCPTTDKSVMLDIFIEQTCVENRALELSIMRLRYRNDINDIV